MTEDRGYFEALCRGLDGDAAMAQRFCRTFLAHCDTYLGCIRTAVEKRQIRELKRLAHSFKSSFDLLGDAEACTLTRELESMEGPASWTEAGKKIEALETRLVTIKNAFRTSLQTG